MTVFGNLIKFQRRVVRAFVILAVACVMCAQPSAARVTNAPLINAANYFESGDGWSSQNGWNSGFAMSTSLGGSYILDVTNSATGNKYFRFCDAATCTSSNRFGPSGTSDILIALASSTSLQTWNSTNGKAYYVNVSNTSYHYVFKTIGSGSSAKLIVFEIQGGVQSISSTSLGPSSTVCPAQTPTVNATLSGSLAAGQTVWIRYSTDNFATSQIVQMTCSGTSCTASIPSNVNTAGTTVKYYMFTSGNVPSISSADADFYTINYLNNGGSNYSYTVANSWTTASNGSWGTASTWTCGAVPPANQAVVINNAVTMDVDATVSSLTINTGASYSDTGAGNTLTIVGTSSASPVLTNNGTFVAGTGTVAFQGQSVTSPANFQNGKVYGSSATTFNNVTLTYNGGTPDATHVFGVDFYDQSTGKRATIDGILTLNAGTFVAHAENGSTGTTGTDGAPFYGPNSTLLYNNGSSLGVFNSAEEWKPGTCGSAGVPYNVEIANATTVNLAAAHTYPANSNKTACGNIIIDSGSTLQSTSATLDVKGNWTNNGGFTSNNGTVLFDGTSAQVIGGTALTDFYNLTLTNANGVNLGVAADANQQVENTLTLNGTLLTLGPNNLIMGQNATAVSGSFGATNMVVADGAGSMCKVGTNSTNADFTFPIGDVTVTAEYSPLTIDYTAISGSNETTCVRVVDAVEPNNTSTDKLSRYWPISTSGLSASTATLTGYYTDADVVGTESNILGGIDVGTNNWTVYGGVSTSANTVPAANSPLLIDSNGTVNFTGIDSSLPASIAWFRAGAAPRARGNGMAFDWQTSQQVGVIGFNLYAQTPQGKIKINKTLIPSQRANAFTPLMYHYEAAVKDASAFFIEHVDALGGSRSIGPFAPEKEYGAQITLQKTDWAAIHASRAQMAQRTAAPQTAQAVDLGVSKTGIYRLTYEALLAAGYDFGGVSAADIALVKNGAGVAIYLGGPATFGPGAFIEFYGEALDTLYTKTNVYHLRVDGALAARVAEDTAAISPGAIAPAYYMETALVKKNKAYSFAAPASDPWYEDEVLAYTAPVERNYTISVDHMVAGVTPTLTVNVWGVTDWPQAPDHSLSVALNGSPIASALFDGSAAHTLSGAAAGLANGDNALKITLPGDSGVAYDMQDVVSYGATYARAFVPRDGALAFSAAADVFEISGLDAATASAWRKDASGLARLSVTPAGANARLRGTGATASYAVQSAPALLTPALMAVPPRADITTGNARFLVIAHPDFISAAQPLVSYHQQRGWQTKVVNVQDIYQQFGDGVFGPQAIRAYIAYAAQNMGTQAVMLVGGDTYDYFDYLGLGAVSFIPTLYAPTSSLVQFAPVDPLFTDLNNDGRPDLPIGRLPVKTAEDMATLTQKTLAFAAKSYGRTALFAEGANDSMMKFSEAGQDFAARLPSAWQVGHASVDALGRAATHNAIIGGFNAGTSLITFIGHSGPTSWDDLDLFHTSDARALTNAGKPAVVVQWGCWNTYFVEPQYQTMGDALLLEGDRGAAAVLGATALTRIPSNEALGQALTARLGQNGATLGGALQTAKDDVAATQPGYTDAFQAWTLLGDPLLNVDNPQYKVFIPFSISGYSAGW